MIYVFKKPREEACKDYLQGIDRDYNRLVLLEHLRNHGGKLENDSYKITLFYSVGSYEKIKITRKEEKQ